MSIEDSPISAGLLLLPVAAALLLAAHFMRAGQVALAAASIAALALLAVPRAWSARLLQLALLVGALEWLRTLASFAAIRLAQGQPTLRLALILLAAAAFTAASAAVFQQHALRNRYGL